MPYSRLFISKKTRKELQRLSETYGPTQRELIGTILAEYYNLMTMMEMEVSDRYSARKFNQSQKKRLGFFPLVFIGEKTNARLKKWSEIEDQSKTRYMSRLVAMGIHELEFELWEKKALKEYLEAHGMSKKAYKNDVDAQVDFWVWINQRPDYPGAS